MLLYVFVVVFKRNTAKVVVQALEGVKHVGEVTKDRARGTPNPGLVLREEIHHSIFQYQSMDSKIREYIL